MTRWAVIFEDTPAMLEVRRTRKAEHFAYLEQHADKIVLAGGLQTVPEAPHCGGLWIIEAENYDEVNELVLNDPYYAPDCRTYKIAAWGKAPCYGNVVL